VIVGNRPESAIALSLSHTAPKDLFDRAVERGPITVDGISLTVIKKTGRTFCVSIAQYTREHTNVLDRRIGDPLNIETDIMMRYVLQAIQTKTDSGPSGPI